MDFPQFLVVFSTARIKSALDLSQNMKKFPSREARLEVGAAQLREARVRSGVDGWFLLLGVELSYDLI